MNPRWLISVMLKRRALVLAAAVIAVATAIVTHQLQPRQYSCSFQFVVQREIVTSELEALKQYFGEARKPLIDLVGRMQTREVVKRALRQVPGALPESLSAAEQDALAEGLLARLTVKVDEPNRVLTIIVVDRTSEGALALAEALQQVYLADDREMARLPLREKRGAQLVRLNALSKRISELEGARGQLDSMETLERELEDAEKTVGAEETALRDAGAKVDARLAALRQRFSDDWWEVTYVRAEQQSLQHLLAAGELKGDLQPAPDWMDRAVRFEKARRRVLEIIDKLDVEQFRLWSVLPQADRVADLRDEIKTERTALDALQKEIAGVDAAIEAVTPKLSTLIPPQRALAPTSPFLSFSIEVGLICFVFLALGTVYMAETLDTSLRRVEDVEFYGKLDVLGTIPYLAPTEEGISPDVFKSPQAYGGAVEAFRTLKSALGFAMTGLRSPVILVTSASPSEGKSTTTLNLARAWAEEGRRTVIVSANIRHPSIQQYLGISTDQPGLSDFLEGQLREDVLVQETYAPNLWIIPGGRPAMNSSVLLQRAEFEGLLKSLRDKYDGVIIDSPPALHLSDSAVISPHVDAIIVVCALAETRRQDFLRTAQLFRRSTTKPIFVIANLRAAFLRVENRPYYGAYGYYYTRTAR